ncbi:MAG: phosphoribosyltransferase [Gammaproteobacteria bacterium]
MTIYQDRIDAGRRLAEALAGYAGRQDVLVLGLPRGGVPVAAEVARALHAPLDVMVVRKLGAPWQPELAMGAIASGGIRLLNERVVRALGVDHEAIQEVAEREAEELRRRETAYRGDRPPFDARGRQVILVDDGMATGSTMRAAVAAVRHLEPARVVVAVPTAAADTCQILRAEADEVICLDTPEPFMAVGCWYRDFGQTSDAEVTDLLARTPAPDRES